MGQIISVIVPVYNVASYLPECLDSILNQDYPHLEVILIDDGSIDRSGAICDEYAAKDKRIRVIHQANGGAAAAKNAGLRVATGYYLSFVDSDDFLEPGAYSYMVAQLSLRDADVIQCAMRSVFQHGKNVDFPAHNVGSYTQIEYLTMYTKDWTCALMTDKLYTRKLFDGVFFEEGHKIDDEYFTYQGIMNARSIVVSNRCIYNYRQRKSSVMLSPLSKRQILLDRIDYTSKRRKVVISRYPQLRSAFDHHFLDMMIILSRDNSRTEESQKIIRRHISEYFREKDHTAPDIRLIPALLKIRFGRFSASSRNAENVKPDDEDYFP